MPLPRQIKNNLLPLLLLFAAQKLCAQFLPAEDFFNGGAQLYISNNIPAALTNTENGLKLYPNDEKLQKLEKLLKQQQQSQSQQNQNQQQNQQQSSQQNSQDQKKSDEQKQNPADQKKDEQQKSSAENSNDEKKENQNGENQIAGQMTPEEAKRLLDAQKGDEQVLQLKPQGKPEQNQRPVKDW
jgi:Ca-activated chloride channel homolog